MHPLDLSVPLEDGLSTYPEGPKMAIMNRITHAWSAGRYQPPAYSATDRVLMLNEHMGTHVDAPYHFLKEGATIEALDLDRFYGPAVLADVSNRDPSEPISPDQIAASLSEHGEELRPNDIVLVRCWSGSRDDPGFLTATALTPEVGTWVVEAGVKAIGVDLPSVDTPGDRSFPVHMALVQAGIPIYENLYNLQYIGQSRFTFLGLPLRLVGGSGSPVRAVAILDDQPEIHIESGCNSVRKGAEL